MTTTTTATRPVERTTTPTATMPTATIERDPETRLLKKLHATRPALANREARTLRP